MPQSDALHPSVDDGLLRRMLSWIATSHGGNGGAQPLSHGDLQTLSADLGVSPADLLDIFPRAEDDRALMDQMIRAHGLHPGVIHSLPAALLRDLEATCARCASKGRCRRDLKTGTAAARCQSYCGNAEALEAIAQSHRHA